MPAHEGKRSLEVIEELDGKSFRVVTPRAVGRLCIAVGILVAAGALKGQRVIAWDLLLHARQLDLGRRVALGAGHGLVPSGQRESRLLVVESRDRKEMLVGVTALAASFQLSSMWILMTALAGVGQRREANGHTRSCRKLPLLLPVAFSTGCFEMGPVEGEVGS